MLCECSLHPSIQSVIFNDVTENVPEFDHMNNDETLTHVIMMNNVLDTA